jgi:hypothetical protein
MSRRYSASRELLAKQTGCSTLITRNSLRARADHSNSKPLLISLTKNSRALFGIQDITGFDEKRIAGSPQPIEGQRIGL